MKNLKKKIFFVLKNEKGGPNIEQLMGIAVALVTGVGLFIFGEYVHDWFNGSAKTTVTHIKIPDNSSWDI